MVKWFIDLLKSIFGCQDETSNDPYQDHYPDHDSFYIRIQDQRNSHENFFPQEIVALLQVDPIPLPDSPQKMLQFHLPQILTNLVQPFLKHPMSLHQNHLIHPLLSYHLENKLHHQSLQYFLLQVHQHHLLLLQHPLYLPIRLYENRSNLLSCMLMHCLLQFPLSHPISLYQNSLIHSLHQFYLESKLLHQGFHRLLLRVHHHHQ